MHRDLKPANLFLRRYGLEYDFAKVLDFGLVKNREELFDVGLTHMGIIPGTPT
ncbi:MAG: serine/threonine-protein kinase [Bradymonadia bacterium]